MAARWLVDREAPLMRSYSAKSDASGESNANGNGERKSSAYNLGIVFLRRQHRISRKCLHLRYWERIYSPTARLLGVALACGGRVYERGRGAYYGRIGQRQRFHEPLLRAQQFQRLWKLRNEGTSSDVDRTSAKFLVASYIPRSTTTSPKLARFLRSFSLDPFYSNEFENDNDSCQQQPTRTLPNFISIQ